jgi:hypothetical protein
VVVKGSVERGRGGGVTGEESSVWRALQTFKTSLQDTRIIAVKLEPFCRARARTAFYLFAAASSLSSVCCCRYRARFSFSSRLCRTAAETQFQPSFQQTNTQLCGVTCDLQHTSLCLTSSCAAVMWVLCSHCSAQTADVTCTSIPPSGMHLTQPCQDLQQALCVPVFPLT